MTLFIFFTTLNHTFFMIFLLYLAPSFRNLVFFRPWCKVWLTEWVIVKEKAAERKLTVGVCSRSFRSSFSPSFVFWWKRGRRIMTLFDPVKIVSFFFLGGILSLAQNYLFFLEKCPTNTQEKRDLFVDIFNFTTKINYWHLKYSKSSISDNKTFYWNWNLLSVWSVM